MSQPSGSHVAGLTITTIEPKDSTMMTIDRLRKLFPAAFVESPQPLARFIHKAITKRLPDVDQASLSEALEAYTSSPAYLQTCKSGAARLDLDGQPKGTVTGYEALAAAYRLDHDGQWPDRKLGNKLRKQAWRENRAAARAAAEAAKPKRLSLNELKEAAKARQK